MATTSANSHKHPVKVGGKTYDTGSIGHQHTVPDQFTPAEVAALKLLVAAGGGGGGTTPDPNPPPVDPPAITPTGITVSGTTTTTTNVAWNTTDASTGLVQYGTTTAYGSSTSSTSSGTTGNRTLSGLTPGQTYHFRVVTSSGSTTVYSSDRTFTTTAQATLPGAPTGLTATGGNAQVVLAWTAPANNGGSAITGYRIFRNGTSLTTDTASPYTDSTAVNGTTYSYTVAAITAVGEGPQSASASATPAAAGDINPPIISNVVISGITTTGATISWTTNEAATGFVEYGLTTGYGSQTAATSSGTSHNRTLSGLLPNKTYQLQIRATDTAGNGPTLSGNRSFTTLNTSPDPSPTRPFAAPTITNTVQVAAGANVQSIVDAAPDGTRFNFAAGATFTMANGIYLNNRHHLDFVGNGATIYCTNNGSSTAASMFKLDNLNTDIRISGFTLRGSNLNTTTVYNPSGGEFQMGVVIYDGIRIEVGNCNVRQVYGDGVFVAGKQSPTYRSSDQVWVHDSTFDYIGRMGITHNAALRSTVERCTFGHVGLFVYDIECDFDFEVVDDVEFINNDIGSYGHSPLYTNWFFACSGGSALADVSNVLVEGNTVTTGAPQNSPNNTSAKGGLASTVDRGGRVTNVTIRGNSTGKAGAGPVMTFSKVDGLVVTGNTQPLTSGSLVSTSDCPGAVTSPNP